MSRDSLPSGGTITPKPPLNNSSETALAETGAIAPTAEPKFVVANQPKSQGKMIGKIVGNFRIIEEIGEGGFGAVYRAEHIFVQQTVAMKLLRTEHQDHLQATERFLREANSLAKLQHKNIVKFFDFGKLPQGEFYLAMEYLEGQSLHEQLKISPILPIERVKWIIGSVCDALAYVHRNGIIHRDLKASNIFLCCKAEEKEEVKLIDFGIVGHVGQEENPSPLTRTGAFIGTAEYAAPEQARGTKRLDGRTDLYSLGVVLYLLLTGHRPFSASSTVDMLLQHIIQPPPLLQEIAPWGTWHNTLDEFFRKALAKDPVQRPVDAHQFWQECSQALDMQLSLDEKSGVSLRQLHAQKTPNAPSSVFAKSQQMENVGLSPKHSVQEAEDRPNVQQNKSVQLDRIGEKSEIILNSQTDQEVQVPEPATASTAPTGWRSMMWVGLLIFLVVSSVGVWFVLPPRGKSISSSPTLRQQHSDIGIRGSVHSNTGHGNNNRGTAQNNETPQKPRPTPAPDHPPSVQSVQLRLKTIPASAEIWFDGKLVARSTHIFQGKSGEMLSFQVKRKGYVSQTIQHRFDNKLQDSTTIRLAKITTATPHKRVWLLVKTVPADAEIWLADKRISRSTHTFQGKSGENISFQVKRKGYIPQTIHHQFGYKLRQLVTVRLKKNPFGDIDIPI